MQTMGISCTVLGSDHPSDPLSACTHVIHARTPCNEVTAKPVSHASVGSVSRSKMWNISLAFCPDPPNSMHVILNYLLMSSGAVTYIYTGTSGLLHVEPSANWTITVEPVFRVLLVLNA